MEKNKVIHKYKMSKTSWGIAIDIHGVICDNNEILHNKENDSNDIYVKIDNGIFLQFLPDRNENIGPSDSYNQMHSEDYPFLLDGLKRVVKTIKQHTKYVNTLIIINRLEYSLCDFQEEGLIAGIIEWAAKAFDFKCPAIDVTYHKDINKYIYKF